MTKDDILKMTDAQLDAGIAEDMTRDQLVKQMAKRRSDRLSQHRGRRGKRSYVTEIENLQILVAWARGMLSEGQAAKNSGFRDPCEYNPAEKRECYETEVHASADWIVGANGKWRLCNSCAALPEFKRLRVRKRID